MQPLPVAEKAWFTPRSGTFHRRRAGGGPCTLHSAPGARLHRAQPFRHGVQEPVLVWFGKSGRWDSSRRVHLSSYSSPGLNRSNLFPLTLEGKIKPYLFLTGQITFFRSGHIHGEVDSAEWRAGNETGMDLLFAWQILSICYGSGLWFLLPRSSVQCTQTVHSLA